MIAPLSAQNGDRSTGSGAGAGFLRVDFFFLFAIRFDYYTVETACGLGVTEFMHYICFQHAMRFDVALLDIFPVRMHQYIK